MTSEGFRWPVYVWRHMAEEPPPMRVVPGEEISLPVTLEDAAGSGLPAGLCVDVTARIGDGPRRARRLAQTSAGDFAWRGDEPAGSELRLAAFLDVDTFSPPDTRVAGRVASAWIASSAFAPDDRGAWCPVGPWTLTALTGPFSGFGPHRGGSPEVQDHGLVMLIETYGRG